MSAVVLPLLKSRRFAPLFITQFLGAFNDNLLKSGLAIFVTYRLAQTGGIDAATLVMLAGGIFIAPFFLFSGASGTLADQVDKAKIARWVKIAEIFIMATGAAGFALASVPLLLVALFGLGTHSTVFGPIKYALLPEHLRRARAGRRQCVDRGRHVPRDPVRHDPRRLADAGRQRRADRRHARRRGRVDRLDERALHSARAAPLGDRRPPSPAPRFDRRRQARGVARRAVPAGAGAVVVLVDQRHARVGAAGVREGRVVRRRAGRDVDARALRDRYCRRFVARRAPAARRGERAGLCRFRGC